jgi:hypothetical protein
MQYSLRTLLIATMIGPPLLWGAYVLCKPADRLFWIASFLLAMLICAPYAIIRLQTMRLK